MTTQPLGDQNNFICPGQPVYFRCVDVRPMKPRRIEPKAISDEAAEAIGRLQAWIRDYGHLKEPVFVEDLKTVIDAALHE